MPSPTLLHLTGHEHWPACGHTYAEVRVICWRPSSSAKCPPPQRGALFALPYPAPQLHRPCPQYCQQRVLMLPTPFPLSVPPPEGPLLAHSYPSEVLQNRGL